MMPAPMMTTSVNSSFVCNTRRAATASSTAWPSVLKMIVVPAAGRGRVPARISPISALTLAPERMTSPDSSRAAS